MLRKVTIFVTQNNFYYKQKSRQQGESRKLKKTLKALRQTVQDKNRLAKLKEKTLRKMVTSVNMY